MVFEVVYVLIAIGASLAFYFKFIDKPLDKALDKIFVSWHVSEVEELEKV